MLRRSFGSSFSSCCSLRPSPRVSLAARDTAQPDSISSGCSSSFQLSSWRSFSNQNRDPGKRKPLFRDRRSPFPRLLRSKRQLRLVPVAFLLASGRLLRVRVWCGSVPTARNRCDVMRVFARIANASLLLGSIGTRGGGPRAKMVGRRFGSTSQSANGRQRAMFRRRPRESASCCSSRFAAMRRQQ